MSVELKGYGLDKDQEIGIPYDFHCTCGHVASDHWYATGSGTIVSGRCHQCPLDLNTDICKEFRADNLVHLEKLAEENKI